MAFGLSDETSTSKTTLRWDFAVLLATGKWQCTSQTPLRSPSRLSRKTITFQRVRSIFVGLGTLLLTEPPTGPAGKTNLMTNVLFVCSANKLRSPTAEQVFSTWPGVETDSAGLNRGATTQLSSEQIEWADIIFVMEKTHRSKLAKNFRAHLNSKRVICLDIPDNYEFMDPVLVRILETKAGRFLGNLRPASAPEMD
jgi:predicted protein tyrosine phosphatase